MSSAFRDFTKLCAFAQNERRFIVQNLQKIIEIIQRVCSENNISVNKALNESGVGKDLIANMRKGMTPAVDKIADLAAYLDVTMDYLVGLSEQKTNKNNLIKNEEKKAMDEKKENDVNNFDNDAENLRKELLAELKSLKKTFELYKNFANFDNKNMTAKNQMDFESYVNEKLKNLEEKDLMSVNDMMLIEEIILNRKLFFINSVEMKNSTLNLKDLSSDQISIHAKRFNMTSEEIQDVFNIEAISNDYLEIEKSENATIQEKFDKHRRLYNCIQKTNEMVMSFKYAPTILDDEKLMFSTLNSFKNNEDRSEFIGRAIRLAKDIKKESDAEVAKQDEAVDA